MRSPWGVVGRWGDGGVGFGVLTVGVLCCWLRPGAAGVVLCQNQQLTRCLPAHCSGPPLRSATGGDFKPTAFEDRPRREFEDRPPRRGGFGFGDRDGSRDASRDRWERGPRWGMRGLGVA